MLGTLAVLISVVLALSSSQLKADDDGPAASPFHRMLDGNGQIIPCRCWLNGRLVPFGTTVCMRTHAGVQMARCDLAQNVTTWIPTGAPCEVSRLPAALTPKDERAS